jgi:hypothetical protein
VKTGYYIEHSNNAEAQKAAEQAPSTIAPVVLNIEDLKPV